MCAELEILSDEARDALVWLSSSSEAAQKTCAEARKLVPQRFGQSVADELEAFFGPPGR